MTDKPQKALPLTPVQKSIIEEHPELFEKKKKDKKTSEEAAVAA